MSNYKRAACFFAVAMATGSFIAWLGGYDFDHRGGDVAAGFAVVLCFACGAAVIGSI